MPGDELASAGHGTSKILTEALPEPAGIRHFLLWLNNQIFRLYFFNGD